MKNYPAWSEENVVQFYQRERHRLEDLYDSERALLVPALEESTSVLDVGCAAGGLYNILEKLKPGIRYTGVDVSPEMIAQARCRYPSAQFQVSDCSQPDFPEGAFDLVLSMGVLNHNPNYLEMIREHYRVSRKGCVLDLPRMVRAPYTFERSTSHIVLKGLLPNNNPAVPEAETIVPYVLCNPQPMFEFLVNQLKPRPCALAAVGYYGKPNPSAVVPVTPVCFCVIYLKKGDPQTRRTKLLLDLPKDIAAAIQLEGAESVPTGRAAIAGLIRDGEGG